MVSAEFSLIDRYFSRTGAERDDVLCGVGDDAALVRVPPRHELIVAVSTRSAGIHFNSRENPGSLASQCLAAALNRLAASAAEPTWITLTLAMPTPDEAWLAGFASTLEALTVRQGIRLIGGDTTRGPLRITLHAHGLAPNGMAIGPNLARPAELIYVTGSLGSAERSALAGQHEPVLTASDRDPVEVRADRPEARLSQGIALRGLANAAVSISDGLANGLLGLLEASGVGARLKVDSLPVSPEVSDQLSVGDRWMSPLMAPGNYELCFTVSPDKRAELESRFAALPVGCTWIGTVEQARGLRCVLADGTDIALEQDSPASPL